MLCTTAKNTTRAKRIECRVDRGAHVKPYLVWLSQQHRERFGNMFAVFLPQYHVDVAQEVHVIMCLRGVENALQFERDRFDYGVFRGENSDHHVAKVADGRRLERCF